MVERDAAYSIDELRKEQQARAIEHYKNQREIIRLLGRLHLWLVAIFVLIIGLAVAKMWA
jgi:hypothetical protein